MVGKPSWPERVVFLLSLLHLFVLPWQASIPLVDGAQRVGAFLALVLGGAWFAVVTYRRVVRRPHAFHLAFAVFIGMHIISVLWTVDMTRTAESVLLFAMVGCMVYIYWDLYDNRLAIEFGLQALLLGIFVAAILVLFVYATTSDDIFRRSFGFTNFNATAISRKFVFGLPIAAFLYYGADRFRTIPWKLINASYLLVGTAAIIVTGSRQAFVLLVTLAIILGIAFVYYRKQICRSYPKTAILTIVSALSIAFITPQIHRFEIFERILTIRSIVQEGTLNNRVLVWEAGFDAISYRPWVGTGSGTFPSVIESFLIANGHELDDFLSVIYPHNIFIGTMAEVGIIGLIALTAALLIVVREIIGSNNFLFAGTIMISWFILGMVADLHHYMIPWLLLVFLLAITSAPGKTRYWTVEDVKSTVRHLR
jgi:O-antigen ligase